ncbi:LppU family putative lipoprotein [Mycobacterium bourgelatii]|uniref:Lipoprotein LppU n=1 Tax=Mycobacterium bourgelatii TaxID=1273442 RepID=A0A7I9YMB0_MYCBU|nr:hypothetical protein [Mycobacterium bourgelatii]MCV6977733.1 hypothetical protein [Mycobacterium bourgelatii]GFG89789.1 hypothetical protein MBOU_18310 [Mycobacterium bourgelatii]
MRNLLLALAVAGCWLLAGCSSRPNAADYKVGECIKLSGSPDTPRADTAACGSPESNFRLVASVDDREHCPADVDSSYSAINAIDGSSKTLCLDVDWVVGGCMSIDPGHVLDPVRVECNDVSAPNRQRATQILKRPDGPVSVDQCATGLGYVYAQRGFVVCVEAMSGAPAVPGRP